MKVWAYIHPKLNILCCAVLLEAVPEGVEAIEFEVENPSDIVYDGVKIRLKTPEEKLQERKNLKLQALRNYIASLLTPTDYVVTKIQEALLTGEAIEPLQQRYADILARRQAIREWTEATKQAINNATSFEDLEGIRIEFTG